MTTLIITLSLVIALLASYKWLKWKFKALTAIAFMIENYREPTAEENRYYGVFVLKKMLHIS